MNLIIDIGNTFAKIALFENNEWINEAHFKHNDLNFDNVTKHLNITKINKAIYSTVSHVPNDFFEEIRNKKIPLLNARELNLPIKIDYKTPNTLGFDRLAAAMGARVLKPNETSIIIDAGTALTIDLFEDGKTFKGGIISPGMNMRFKALHDQTANLPETDVNGEISLTAQSTHDCIRSGVVNGIIFEIQEYIKQYSFIYNRLNIFMTGGDTYFLHKKFNNCIFATPNLVTIGLNEILNINS